MVFDKRIYDAVFGFAIGDALGVPFEFSKRGTFECKGMVKAKFPNPRCILPVGTWSDDTSLMLCVLDALRYYPNKKKIYKKYRSNCIEWLLYGKFSVGRFDVGVSTFKGILSMATHIPNKAAKNVKSNGNGGLMKILPIAFLNINTDEKILEYIKLFNSCSHAHDLSNEACLFYVKLLKNLLNNDVEIQTAIYNSCTNEAFTKQQVSKILSSSEQNIKSTGFVVDTLQSVIYCLGNTDNYKNAVLKAVNLGHDTDSIAALVGCVAGLYYGYDTVPTEWKDALRGVNLIKLIFGEKSLA